MISKLNHPKIELKSWISVEGAACLITQVYKSNSISGACEVVTDFKKPVNRDVCWDGEKWFFSTRPVFFNAAQTNRLKDLVTLFQQKA